MSRKHWMLLLGLGFGLLPLRAQAQIDCHDIGCPASTNPCLRPVCLANGHCLNVPLTCNDQDACTTDSCDPASGCVHIPVFCDDDDLCTTDSCDPAGGCFHEPVVCPNNPVGCLVVPRCIPTFGCVMGADVSACDDGIDCTIDECLENGACEHDPEPRACNDFNDCTRERCDRNLGCVSVAVVCDDGDDCTTDSCDPNGGCFSEGNSCISLDIKPGACPNVVQRAKSGVVPVAIVGDGSFDVSQIDVSTLELSRADGLGGVVFPVTGGSAVVDLTAPFLGDLCGCGKAPADGIVDLRVNFPAAGLFNDLLLGNFPNGTLVTLTLSGQFLDGTSFSTSDCVKVKR